MKYQGENLRRVLAAQYALGTLRGGARRRFEQLLQNDAALRTELRWWEARLGALGARLRPVAPRARVWAAIDYRVNAAAPRVTPIVRPLPPAPPPANTALWRRWALAASLAALALALGLWRERLEPAQVVRVEVPVEQPMPYVAMLQTDTGAKWLVTLAPERGTLKVAASGSYPLDAARNSLELWLLDEAGTPHSLGILPMSGEKQMPMPRDMPMPAQATLAVSLEPAGGSPTGLPTGSVILTAAAVRAG